MSLLQRIKCLLGMHKIELGYFGGKRYMRCSHCTLGRPKKLSIWYTRIPLVILIWLPERIQNLHILATWDWKSDEEIRIAQKDAYRWIELADGHMRSEITEKIAIDCVEKLTLYILPQIKKRRLHSNVY